MTNNKLVNAFIARLENLKVSAALKEKYVAEYKRLLAMRNDALYKKEEHLQRIKFGCFATDTKRLSSEKQLLRAIIDNKPVHFEAAADISAEENLLACRIINTTAMPTNLRPLSKIHVWQEATKNELPCLTLKEIVTQIPRSLVNKTEVVCLLAEDENIVRDSYNILMDAYEYNIWLFGK